MDLVEFKELFQKKKVVEKDHNVPSQPLVSVCVQTYQHVNYIEHCLDSILMQQTDFDFEILLGEDASNDGTREICIEYAEKYPNKIRLFLHQRENNIEILGGQLFDVNFMYNLYSSKGDYIALCEGDDYWNDELKLQKQINFLKENPQYSVSYHNCNYS